ncbi:MAG: hypothetical protein IKJ68_01910 [Clostridia bacterium]|nr:hypothetical protein [Clostridia bacterium]
MKHSLKTTLLALLLIFSMTIPSVCSFASSAVTMYAPDGRTAQVASTDVEAWRSVGWHEGKESIGVYAADGRTMYVFYKDLAAYKNVGWYILPPVTMYAADGRTLLVDGAEIEAYKNVGWFVSPPVTMYAPDGRTAFVAGSDVVAWKKVGWYDYKVITVYNSSGNSKVVATSSLSTYKSKGWHEGNETIGLYSADDRTMYVFYKDLAAYLKVGWYTKPVPNYKKAYAQILYDYISKNDIFDDTKFNLIHIDNDGIPELVIRHGTWHGAGVNIYTYKNGEAHKQCFYDDYGDCIDQFGSWGDMGYIKYTGIFISDYSGMGHLHTSVHRLSDSGLAYPILKAHSVFADPYEGELYEINGKSVSYTTYTNALSPYKSDSDAFGMGGYSLTRSKVKSVLGY